MTNQEKKAYLMMYQEKWKEIDVLQQEIETLQSRAEKVTSVLSDMPKGGQGDGFVSAVDKIVELKEGLNNKVLEAVDKRYEIAQAIENVKDATHRLLLQRVYINGVSLVGIASEDNYSYRQLKRFHSEALSAIIIKDVPSCPCMSPCKCDSIKLGITG